MEDCFPTFEPSSTWIQQPFIAEMNGNEQLNLHEQHLELQSCQAAKTKFSSSSLIEFWCSILQEYPELAKSSGSITVILFPPTYLCEAAMYALVSIKSTYRNRLNPKITAKQLVINILRTFRPSTGAIFNANNVPQTGWLATTPY